MITLAPNVYVAQYLQAVGRLGPELKERIERNMMVGFQRELTYKLNDGSFSAFGQSDGEGSMWLTAFVLQVFAEIAQSKLVTVDANVLWNAASWMLNIQKPDGSFPSVGRVIHQEMMGGIGEAHPHRRGIQPKRGGGAPKDTPKPTDAVARKASLTAFVLRSLLEAQAVAKDMAAPAYIKNMLEKGIKKASKWLERQTLTDEGAPTKYAHVLRATVRLRASPNDAAAKAALLSGRAEPAAGPRSGAPGGPAPRRTSSSPATPSAPSSWLGRWGRRRRLRGGCRRSATTSAALCRRRTPSWRCAACRSSRRPRAPQWT